METISAKVTYRLHSLTPSTSKETIQTLTKWILFHAATHSKSIQTTLQEILMGGININNSTGTSTSTSNGQEGNGEITMIEWSSMLNVYWNVIHDLCHHYSFVHNTSGGGGSGDANNNTNNKNEKWNAFSDFRHGIAEIVIVPCLEHLWTIVKKNQTSSTTTATTSFVRVMKELRDKLETMHSTWVEVDSFQSPTLLDDIKRVISKIVQFDFNATITDTKPAATTAITSSQVAALEEKEKITASAAIMINTKTSITAPIPDITKEENGIEIDDTNNKDNNIDQQQQKQKHNQEENIILEKIQSKEKDSIVEKVDGNLNTTPPPSMAADDDDDDDDLFGLNHNNNSDDSDDDNNNDGGNETKNGNKDDLETKTASMDNDTKMDVDTKEEKDEIPKALEETKAKNDKKRRLSTFDAEFDFESEVCIYSFFIHVLTHILESFFITHTYAIFLARRVLKKVKSKQANYVMHVRQLVQCKSHVI